MPAERDYYEILGVSRSASRDEIKRAYRKLAREYHPDANPDDPEAETKFKQINEAYQVLSDPEKRRTYDQYGHAAAGGSQSGGFGGFDARGFEGFEGFDDINDIFEAFFGGGARSQRSRGARRGRDMEANLELSFEEAAFGCKKEVEITRSETCPTCDGDGARPGTQPETCPECGGSGRVRSARNTPLGQFMTTRTCPRCRGQGRVISDYCPECVGRGRVRKKRTVQVEVPAGVDNGMRLRLGGEGERGEGAAPSGDLYVKIRVSSHPTFNRRGDDVHAELRLSMVEACLGARKEVETLHGKEKISIKPGTQSGDTHRIRDKGIPRLRGYGQGDHIVEVKVVIPRKLSDEEKELLMEFAALRDEDQDLAEHEGFFNRVRKAFNRGGDDSE